MDNFMEFWDNGGRDLTMGIGFGLVALLLNSHDKRIASNEKNLKNLGDCVNVNFEMSDKYFRELSTFKDHAFENFDILAKDINRLATNSGYKGKLGVNQ